MWVCFMCLRLGFNIIIHVLDTDLHTQLLCFVFAMFTYSLPRFRMFRLSQRQNAMKHETCTPSAGVHNVTRELVYIPTDISTTYLSDVS